MSGGRPAATGIAGVATPTPVGQSSSSTILPMVMRTSLPSSPAWGCEGLPQPLRAKDRPFPYVYAVQM